MKENIFSIKYTGTTEGFEQYYGELILNGHVITEYYCRPRRSKQMYITRDQIDGRKLSASSPELLLDKVRSIYHDHN